MEGSSSTATVDFRDRYLEDVFFRVLGPVEVTENGRRYTVGGPKQRSVLALLIAQAGRSVSTERLIDGVYGDDPPQGARRSIQTYLSNLRGELGDVIQAEGTGYVLAADRERIDALRFEDVVATAGNGDEPDETANSLREALSLWRGHPYADVDAYDSVLTTEITRLNELRVGAIEQRVGADLARGRHRELVAELESLTAEHPFREGFRAQQMMALYRSGRQAEALRAYQAARTTLGEQLGIEPSKDLRDLEERLVLQDPSLTLVADKATRTNLRQPFSSFIGRGDELADIDKLLDTNRLVTLTGPGGVGKTRLAIQASSEWLDKHADGVWMVDLTTVSDPELVPNEVRDALGVADFTGQTTATTVGQHIEPREMLLVLDNCEHVVEAVADFVSEMLRIAPVLRILLTSREPVLLPGEVRFAVQPMRIPDVDVGASDAIQLFVERAQAVVAGFGADGDNRAIIERICRRLDGLPLAIELAAAQTHGLSLRQIESRLGDSFSVLGKSRSEVTHHQTMQAAVGWSYDLLREDDRRLFAILGVFAGPFDLDAAISVARRLGLAEEQVVAITTDLVNRSLVETIRIDGELRYRLLETVKEYALARLAEIGDQEMTARAHSEWAISFAESSREHLMGPAVSVWIAKVRGSFAEFREVLERSFESNDPETGVRMLGALDVFLLENGDQDRFLTTSAMQDGAAWIDRLLTTGNVRSDILAPVLAQRGFLLMLQGDTATAAPVLERCLVLFEEVDNKPYHALARICLAGSTWDRADPLSSRELLTSALEIMDTDIEQDWRYWLNLFILSIWELQFGDDPEQLDFLTAELDRWGIRHNSPLSKAHAREIRAVRSLFDGKDDTARQELIEALELYRQAGFRLTCFAHCLDHVALWTLEKGYYEQAASLLGSAESIRFHHVAAPAPPYEQVWHDQAKEKARKQLGAAGFEHHYSKGHASEPEAAAELALTALEGEEGVSVAG